jgi:hypothetical protein
VLRADALFPDDLPILKYLRPDPWGVMTSPAIIMLEIKQMLFLPFHTPTIFGGSGGTESGAPRVPRSSPQDIFRMVCIYNDRSDERKAPAINARRE